MTPWVGTHHSRFHFTSGIQIGPLPGYSLASARSSHSPTPLSQLRDQLDDTLVGFSSLQRLTFSVFLTPLLPNIGYPFEP